MSESRTPICDKFYAETEQDLMPLIKAGDPSALPAALEKLSVHALKVEKLARELERHCEALAMEYQVMGPRGPKPAVSAYESWKRQQLGSKE